MKTSLSSLLVSAALLAVFAAPASASVINFTGGNVVRFAGPNQTTNNSVTWDNVDYYEQNGFKLDFVGGTGLDSKIGN